MPSSLSSVVCLNRDPPARLQLMGLTVLMASRLLCWILMGLGAQKGAVMIFRHSMTTWITFVFPPPLSHLMVLFENARGQAKSLEEDSLPTFSKNYRCQREFCLSSNWSSDPRIWCMTTHFYCFCINAEKWPPCLLNHMKHLNQSPPPACSGKKQSHSPMAAWN